MSLHFNGKRVNFLGGYSITISDELNEALNEMLDAADTHDADRIRAAIDRYEELSKEEAPRRER